jgi:hypothetical protein
VIQPFVLAIAEDDGWHYHDVSVIVPPRIRELERAVRVGLSVKGDEVSRFWREVVQDLSANFDLDGKTHILKPR